MKQCTKCKEIKSLDDFYNRPRSKDGKRGQCKCCESADNKQWIGENKERRFQQQKQWERANPNKIKQYRKTTRENERIRHPGQANARRKRWNDRHLQQNALCHLEHRLRTDYGMTLDNYLNMLSKQNNCCAICGVTTQELDRRISVDHCHKTGKVRGLLCQKCNNGLGFFKDSPALLTKAADYLLVFLDSLGKINPA